MKFVFWTCLSGDIFLSVKNRMIFKTEILPQNVSQAFKTCSLWKKQSVDFATVFEMLVSMSLKPIILQAFLF